VTIVEVAEKAGSRAYLVDSAKAVTPELLGPHRPPVELLDRELDEEHLRVGRERVGRHQVGAELLGGEELESKYDPQLRRYVPGVLQFNQLRLYLRQ